MTSGITTLESTATVNDVMRQYPATTAVFNRLGIDACCGGAAPLHEAAERDGADLAALLAALQDVIHAAGEAR
jgi:regulator of cell morphogenesis and NO signaling